MLSKSYTILFETYSSLYLPVRFKMILNVKSVPMVVLLKVTFQFLHCIMVFAFDTTNLNVREINACDYYLSLLTKLKYFTDTIHRTFVSCSFKQCVYHHHEHVLNKCPVD